MPMIPLPEGISDSLAERVDTEGMVEVVIRGKIDGDKFEAIELNGQTIPGYESEDPDYNPGEDELADEEKPDKRIIMAFKRGANA